MLSYDVLAELQDYMLNNENIQKSVQMKMAGQMKMVNDKPRKIDKMPLVKPSQVKTHLAKKVDDDIFIPDQPDSLFWCFYIIKNGDVKYESLNYKNALVAKQHKIDIVSCIRQHKDIAKMYKFDTLTNLENNLANDNHLTPKTFLTLCAIENINVVFVNNKTYYELCMNDTNIIYIVHELASQSKYCIKYGFEMATLDSLDKIRTTLYKLEHIGKPIKGASSYKLQDVIDICNKLSIDITNKETGKKKTKTDLYESIVQYFH